MPTQPAVAPLRNRTAWLGLLAGLLLFSGCGTPPARPAAEAPAPTADRALLLSQRGQHEAAAALYERLAASSPASGLAFGLSAVREWLAAKRPEDAQRVFAAWAAQPADATQADARRLLQIELLLARNLPADAWRAANALPEPRSARGLQWQQRAAAAAGRPLDAIRAEQALERLVPNDAERASARRELLTQLRDAAARGTKLDPQATRDTLQRGWLELGQLAATSAHSPLGAARAITRWRTRYPGHPAASIAMAELTVPPSGPIPLAAASGTSVALLLPLTGRQAVAGQLVRDGFLSALTVLPEAQRPPVKVYDTGDPGIGNALRAVQADGAGFIVGPLTREEAAQAVANNARRAPMLLLNALPGESTAPTNTWQFALSPEDEARLVARRALAQGQRRAVVFVPTGDWGGRVLAAFRDAFTTGGGTVLDLQTYNPSQNDFTARITAALRVDDSRARHKRIEAIVGGKLQFEPRRRADIDFIFAAGQAVALRQIRAQLRFFYAGDVPTYMTSEGFDPEPSANIDLDGVLFPDMPWMLQEQGPVADARTATQAAWSDKGPRLPRLFAFGYDAAQLMLALRSPGWQWPLLGVTGRLNPDAQGRIHRELDWAQIRKGKPQAITSP